MAVSNLQETLLFYTRRKNSITRSIANIQMQQLSASRQTQEQQLRFQKRQEELFYDPVYGYDADRITYSALYEEMSNEHEAELAKIQDWETKLNIEKDSLETQLNEISTYEKGWQTMLKTNIKNEFTYGAGGGGK